MATPDTTPGFRTQDPRNNVVLEDFAYISDDQVTSAVTTSHSAWNLWRNRSIDERALVALRIAELLEERCRELAETAALEVGKALDQAEGEVRECIDIFQYYATHGPLLAADRSVGHITARPAVIQSQPIGAILGIMPWNFPYYQVARFVAPNLVLGNTILLKHAETCPRSALSLEKVFLDAGVPQGVYQNLFITHRQVERIIADDRLQGVSLTGSERAGAVVASRAGAQLKKVVLELGGSDAHIYFSVEDPREAAREAIQFRMDNMGQACTSNKRLLVHEDFYNEFVAESVRLVSTLQPGDPFHPEDGAYYPMSSEQSAAGLVRQIQRAVDQGATLHVGGNRLDSDGAWVRPAVLTGVTENMDAYHQEFFGPVIVVYRISSEVDAIRLANDTPYGLAGAVFSRDLDQAVRVAEQLDVGMSYVNTVGAEAADLPFGGVKRSGFGRELGPLGLDEFANKRLLYINGDAANNQTQSSEQ